MSPGDEVCAECDGSGLVEAVGGVVDCEWCDGTGEVAAEELAPPSPPQSFNVWIRRKNSVETYSNITQFDIDKDCYLMADAEGTRIVVPMSGSIIDIMTKPAT